MSVIFKDLPKNVIESVRRVLKLKPSKNGSTRGAMIEVYSTIKDLKSWKSKGHVAFFVITQFLSGQGYFRKYLNKMGKKQEKEAECKYCRHDTDDTAHTFFECGQWTEDLRRLETVMGIFRLTA